MLAIDQTPEPLSLDHLAAYGFSPDVLAVWRGAGIRHLLPLQQQALTESPLLRGGNVVALAPTSAGKTFLGELAALRNRDRDRKTLFLAPTRALASEQFRHLQTRYAALGVRVILSTSDSTTHDALLREGDFDIAVLVYEKLRALLVSHPHLLYSTGTVVADELQILGDPDRGEAVDLLLTQLVHGDTPVQVIGLTAVVSDGEHLARWLDAHLLVSTQRPAELREGVYCGEHGSFHYTTGAQPAQWHEESLPLARSRVVTLSEAESDAGSASNIIRLAALLARRGESVLLFVPTRAMSRQACKLVAAELGAEAAPAGGPDQWEDLRQAEESLTQRQLLEAVESGVAFHNADLTADLRLLVEEAFAQGHLKVLVATPTLAQGVNLKAQNVIQLPVMLRGDSRGGGSPASRQAQVPISVGRYRNQAGRAGRYGSGSDFGRSLLVARNHAETLRLARSYVGAAAEAPLGRFTCHSLQHFILSNVHTGAAENFSGLFSLLSRTWAYHSGAVQQNADFENRLADNLRELLEAELVEETAGHRLQLTGSGQAMAAGGYRASTMREMMAYAADWQHRAPHPLEVLCAAAFTADGESFPLAALPSEMKTNYWRRAIAHVMKEEGVNPGPSLDRALNPPGGLCQARHASLKMALTAHAWITTTPTADLEELYQVPGGTMHALGGNLAWLLGGLSACAGVLQCEEATIRQIDHLARRLPLGLCEEASGLAGLEVPGLGRQYLNRLACDGFATTAALQSAPDDILAALLPDRLARHLRAQYPYTGPAAVEDDSPSAKEEAASATAPVLELDPAEPGLVLMAGQALRLTPKPYALLMTLARRAGCTVPYRNIDAAVWPGEKVEPQQISAHKASLVSGFARVMDRAAAEALLITEAGTGLRLNIPPESVIIREAAHDLKE